MFIGDVGMYFGPVFTIAVRSDKFVLRVALMQCFSELRVAGRVAVRLVEVVFVSDFDVM